MRFASSTWRRRWWAILKIALFNLTLCQQLKLTHFLIKLNILRYSRNDVTGSSNESTMKVKITISKSTHIMLDNHCHPYMHCTTVQCNTATFCTISGVLCTWWISRMGTCILQYLILCVDLCLSFHEHSHNVNLSCKWCCHKCSPAILCGLTIIIYSW